MAKKTAPKKSGATTAPTKKAKAATAPAKKAPAKKAKATTAPGRPSVIKTGFDARNRPVELLQIGSQYKCVNTITGDVRSETDSAEALKLFDQMTSES